MKQYGVTGVANVLQLGRQGNHITGATGEIVLQDNEGTPVKATIADGIRSDHAATVGQLNNLAGALVSNDLITVGDTPGTFTSSIPVPTGAKIVEVMVNVTSNYNGTNPLLKIGTSATNASNIDDGYGSDLTAIDSFLLPIRFATGENAQIVCTLEGTGITQGEALVSVRWAKDN